MPRQHVLQSRTRILLVSRKALGQIRACCALVQVCPNGQASWQQRTSSQIQQSARAQLQYGILFVSKAAMGKMGPRATPNALGFARMRALATNHARAPIHCGIPFADKNAIRAERKRRRATILVNAVCFAQLRALANTSCQSLRTLRNQKLNQ